MYSVAGEGHDSVQDARRVGSAGSGEGSGYAVAGRVNGELQALGWDPVTDPVARYADLAGETLAFKDLARAKVNELSSWEHQGAFDAQDIHAAVKVY